MTSAFTDPIAQVIITDIESGEEWHWGSPDRPFLTSVQIVYVMTDTNPKLSVGVDVPYEFAIPMLDIIESTPFKQHNLVKARIGYASGKFLPWVAGYLPNGGKGLSMDANGLTGTLEIGIDSTKTIGYTVTKDVLAESGYDAVKLLTGLARLLGNEISVTDAASANLNAWKLLKPNKVSYQNAVDFYGGLANKGIWDAIKEVCLKNNVKFYIQGDRGTLQIFTENDKFQQKLEDSVVNKYVLRGILNPENRQYPCYGFTPAEDATNWVSKGPTASASGVDASGIDTETGEDVSKTLDPKEQEEPIDGRLNATAPQDIRYSDKTVGEKVADIAKTDGKKGTYMSGPVMPGGSDIFYSQARRFQTQGNPGLDLEIQTIGHADEYVGRLCELWGCGALFNDRYFIQGITHSYEGGAWNMTLNCHRRGWKAVTGEKQETAGGQLQK